MEYESFKYGSPDLPAYSWRDSSGEYFAYETGTEGIVAFWSSEVGIGDLETAIDQAGLRIDRGRKDALLTTQMTAPESDERPVVRHQGPEGLTVTQDISPGGVVRHQGSWRSIIKKDLFPSAILARIPLKDDLKATWLAPHQLFEDQDFIKGSVGIIVPRDNILAIKGLARVTGNTRFLDESHCTITVGIGSRRRCEGEKIAI